MQSWTWWAAQLISCQLLRDPASLMLAAPSCTHALILFDILFPIAGDLRKMVCNYCLGVTFSPVRRSKNACPHIPVLVHITGSEAEVSLVGNAGPYVSCDSQALNVRLQLVMQLAGKYSFHGIQAGSHRLTTWNLVLRFQYFQQLSKRIRFHNCYWQEILCNDSCQCRCNLLLLAVWARSLSNESSSSSSCWFNGSCQTQPYMKS